MHGKVRYESKYFAIQYFYKEKQWSINWMCKQLGIARSAYYKWINRPVPKQEQDNIKLEVLIRDYDERFGHILGYRRMTGWINYFNGMHYGKNRVYRIMKKTGIHSSIRKKKRKYIRSSPEVIAENQLKRDFNATYPNEKWVTDVTEFKIPEATKKIYLSAILDLYDRSIVSYVISSRNDNKLVFRTFDNAISANPNAKPMFHTDRGYQYTSKIFHNKLLKQKIQQSMSRKGHCIDNGPTEGFWGILKSEMSCIFKVIDEASLRNAIEKYIYFYNNQRPQKRFNYQTPVQVRVAALNTNAPKQYPIPENKRIDKYKSKWIA